jgi:hypothetical protein
MNVDEVVGERFKPAAKFKVAHYRTTLRVATAEICTRK